MVVVVVVVHISHKNACEVKLCDSPKTILDFSGVALKHHI